MSLIGGLTLNNSILFWELLGVPIIILLGFVFHNLYEWSGENKIIAVIAPINESLWEHLKLGIWPVLFYALFEYAMFTTPPANFLIAKTIEVYFIPLFIVIMFYTYTSILGRNILIIDILIFAIAVLIGQYISYSIISMEQLPEIFSILSMVALGILILIFTLFTFNPLNLPIFEDPSEL